MRQALPPVPVLPRWAEAGTTSLLTVAFAILLGGGFGVLGGFIGFHAAAQLGVVETQGSKSGLFLDGTAIAWLVVSALAIVWGAGAIGAALGRTETSAAREQINRSHNEVSTWRAETDSMFSDRLRLIQNEQQRLRSLEDAFRRNYLDGRHWLANAVADVWDEREAIREFALRNKPHKGVASADILRESRRERRQLLIENRLLKMQLASYEEYFPELVDYRDLILAEAADFIQGESLDDIDPVRLYVSDDEYKDLAPAARNQFALDRYRRRPKSDWEIGRVYERQIGWEYESSGWRVRYEGALRGLADLGRDLVAQRDGQVEIVQCKNWAASKLIREKHIFQLFGTATLYRLLEGLPRDRVRAVFCTTSQLSLEAEAVARELGIDVRQTPLCDYPMIKCNVTSSGERIYHLPFDQMYDRVVIGNVPGECYVATVREAEALGFRRAFRWRPEGKSLV